jgi:hypothetical protein
MWKVNQIYRHDGINYVVVDTVSDGDTLKTATLLMLYVLPEGGVSDECVKISNFSGYTYVQDASDAVIAQAKKIYLESQHIPAAMANIVEGVKHDKEKPRPSLLFRSLNKAVHGVLAVLEFGAKKYAVDNWKKVEQDRYKEALGRHYLAIMAGEKNDPESGLPHIDHLLCCALFISEMEKQNGKH